MNKQNKIVQSLWIGKTLSPLELLTLHSFIYYGHEFHLYLYEELETKIPEEVVVKNANEILPASRIFRYKYNDPISKQGKGSVAGFSDIFRYKLLYEKGGWWVDMDVTCLKPLNFSTPYVFRPNDFLPIVGNFMKCPPKSQLMYNCYEEAVIKVTPDNIDWLKPIIILNKNIKKLKLSNFIHHNSSNLDRWELIALYYFYQYPIDESYHIIHWVNTAWNNKGLNKNIAMKNTTYAKLIDSYDIKINKGSKGHGRFKYIEWKLRQKLIPLLPNSFRLLLKKIIE
ncbi:MAG: glycosyltransferase [Saprospiraceae bacterium]